MAGMDLNTEVEGLKTSLTSWNWMESRELR